MLVNPTYGAGGSEPIEFFMENGLVGDEGSYITTPLDKEIPVGTPLCISMYDASPSQASSPTVVNVVVTMPIGGQVDVGDFIESTFEGYWLRITTTTAGLSTYSGAYRKIYAKISRAVIYDDQIYHET